MASYMYRYLGRCPTDLAAIFRAGQDSTWPMLNDGRKGTDYEYLHSGS